MPETETMIPDVLITALIEQRNSIVNAIEKNKKAVDALDEQILHLMIEHGLEEAFAADGIGVSVVKTAKTYEYTKAAYRYLEEHGLTPYFLGPPKITRKALETLQKEGVLTYKDLAKIEEHTIEDHKPYSLRRKVNKEQAVIP